MNSKSPSGRTSFIEADWQIAATGLVGFCLLLVVLFVSWLMHGDRTGAKPVPVPQQAAPAQ